MTKGSKYSYISVSAALGVDALFAFNMTCRVVVDAASALPEHAILRHIPSGHEECFVKRWSWFGTYRWTSTSFVTTIMYLYTCMLCSLSPHWTSKNTFVCLYTLPASDISDNLTIIFLTSVGWTSRVRLSLLLVKGMRVAAQFFLRRKSILARLSINLRIAQEWKILGCLHVGHLLDEALGENDIDFFQWSVFRFGVEDVDDWEEACVDCSEEEICACGEC